MQTFLPFEDFTQCASILDRARLGKQRVECLQIMKALTNPDYGWQSHPAVRMWRVGGIPNDLVHYHKSIVEEWTSRGYIDNTREKVHILLERNIVSMVKPWWLGWEPFHKSHQAMLYHKEPQYYAQFADAKGEYIWPHIEEGEYHIGNTNIIWRRS